MKSSIRRASKQNWVTISTVSPVASAAAIFSASARLSSSGADLRVAVRIAGNADAADAAAAEHAGIDRIMGAAERPAFGAVAGDDQHVAHAA